MSFFCCTFAAVFRLYILNSICLSKNYTYTDMKKYLFCFIAILIPCIVSAALRTAEQAATIASGFVSSATQSSHSHKAPRRGTDVRLAHTVARPDSDQPAFFIFNKPEGGWVIVSAEDNARTILGYSDHGAFSASHIPSNIQYWFDYYAERIASARPHATEREQSPSRVRKAPAAIAIQPILGDIEWDQLTPYNDLCPMDARTRSYTGCVATAAAQIMRYYRWPQTGQGSITYNWKSDYGTTGTESVDFSAATYDWDNMLETYTPGNYTTEQAQAVALLMYHVGVSCKMQYGGTESNGSGAYTEDMGSAFVNYFRYKNSARYLEKLTTSQFDSIFRAELMAGRPILMGGEKKNGAGHEFVCDGIDENGYFHINWGWSGDSNGYFALSSLDPQQQGAGSSSFSGGYSRNIDCIVGIEPDRDPVPVTAVSITPDTLTLMTREIRQLTATVIPDSASNKGVFWTSSDDRIASVNATGMVRGISAGTAIITVTSFDGDKTASCTVTVSNEVAPPTLLIVNEGAAEYDSKYLEPWQIDIYEDNEDEIPYIRFFPDTQDPDRIAGIYNLSDTCGYLWNDPADPNNSYISILYGRFVVECVGVNDGPNGDNTYHVQAAFTCEDGVDYIVDNTIEISATDANGDAITLLDQIGDGRPEGGDPTAVGSTSRQPEQCAKNIRNGRIIITRGNTRYSILGERID